MEKTEKNAILELTFAFALKIIEYAEELEQSHKYIIARQILKSGTSIGANVREAQGAESRADFVHKFKIAYKEAEETKYWLELCRSAPNYPFNFVLLEDLSDILKIMGKIIATSKNNINLKKQG